MNIMCNDLEGIVKRFSLVKNCDMIESGYLRISTVFKDIEGANIDLFLGQAAESMYREYILTDLGNTYEYMMDFQIEMLSSPKRKTIVADICESLGVILRNGEFCIYLANDEINELPDAMVRLAQTCIRVSDIIFTKKWIHTSTFLERLEEFLIESKMKYKTDATFIGKYNNDVSVHFHVYGAKTQSLMSGLYSYNETTSHSVANEMFRRWYDLADHRTNVKFVTVRDANSVAFKKEDVQRIKELSMMFDFPGQENAIRETLSA